MTLSTQPTCGELYLKALEHYTGFDDAKIALFAPGFVMAHAECLHLRAKRAAMFRPTLAYHELIMDACRTAMELYDGLSLLYIEHTGEFWLFREEWHAMMMKVFEMAQEEMAEWDTERWALWHTLRGRLCAIPESDIDPQYHLRSGYGSQCDTPQERAS